MTSDVDKHRQLLEALRASQGNGNDSINEAVIHAFEHVFEHLERLNSNVAATNPEGDERPLQHGESATLR